MAFKEGGGSLNSEGHQKHRKVEGHMGPLEAKASGQRGRKCPTMGRNQGELKGRCAKFGGENMWGWVGTACEKCEARVGSRKHQEMGR